MNFQYDHVERRPHILLPFTFIGHFVLDTLPYSSKLPHDTTLKRCCRLQIPSRKKVRFWRTPQENLTCRCSMLRLPSFPSTVHAEDEKEVAHSSEYGTYISLEQFEQSTGGGAAAAAADEVNKKPRI